MRYNTLFIIYFLFSPACASFKTKTTDTAYLDATALKAYGRAAINNNELELISSAAHIGFTFTGNECRVYASVPYTNTHNYLQYEVDGVYERRIGIEGSAEQPIIIKSGKKGTHTVWIYKATEAHTGPVIIKKISGQNVKTIERPPSPLIEFIGNSITCGAAADPSEVPCRTAEYHDQHNAYYAYGPRVARALGTNFILSSVSGIGIYRNWNSDGPTMPQVYEKTDFQDRNKQLWDFSKYRPAVVSIALGTNDFSRGDGIKQRLPFDSSAFVNNYVSFIRLVKSKYPAAQIALLSSPMINGQPRMTLQNCLAIVAAKIDSLYPSNKPVALHFFKPMQAHGCTGHPNVEDHAVLAKELEPFFKKLLP